ncbi:uncharacterized protein [Typha latifolia]|uniref:uncharacterized protein n=1 Tax=Typha latifolia TaxID=4733 RepID=UPI003C2F9C41
MALQLIETHRAGAEVYTGAALCKEKAAELLLELHLPNGLLPLPDLDEVGYNRSTGFVWLRQKKAVIHTFKKIGRVVSYGTEVTAFVEDRRMRKMTGVKTKELLIWVSLCDMHLSDPQGKKINFKTIAGIGLSYPVSAFVEEEP